MRVRRGAAAARFAASARPPPPPERDRRAVERIIRDVRERGDAAVAEHEARFSRHRRPVRVPRAEIERARRDAAPRALRAVAAARRRLLASERAVLSAFASGRAVTRTPAGTVIERRMVPIASVGCYVPGGLARYPSSAVMQVVPARAAGVRRIAVATPPAPDGSIDPLTLAAADMCGATEVYRMGGAQAVAALALGTGSIPRVDKITGPGGRFVTMAKSIVSAHTQIDMVAGPTELGIAADSSADARLVAADLASQAEHSADAFCFAATDSARKAREVAAALSEMVAAAPRGRTARAALSAHGFIAVCDSAADALDLCRMIAPEHLEIMVGGAAAAAAAGRRAPPPPASAPPAGLVLAGPDSPSSASDYVLGSNHVLPTGGTARARGPLSALDFVRLATVLRSTRRELEGVSGHVGALAAAEGLPAHHAAVMERLGGGSG